MWWPSPTVHVSAVKHGFLWLTLVTTTMIRGGHTEIKGWHRHGEKKRRGNMLDQNILKACIMAYGPRELKRILHTHIIMSHTAKTSHIHDRKQHLLSYNCLSALTLFSVFMCAVHAFKCLYRFLGRLRLATQVSEITHFAVQASFLFLAY